MQSTISARRSRSGSEAYPCPNHALLPVVTTAHLRRGDFLVPPGGSNIDGTLGYLRAAEELAEQVRQGQLLASRLGGRSPGVGRHRRRAFGWLCDRWAYRPNSWRSVSYRLHLPGKTRTVALAAAALGAPATGPIMGSYQVNSRSMVAISGRATA